ncbi:MAG: radical SAM protein, partial [Planctomycetota bacterium]
MMKPQLKKPTIALVSLGCSKNLVDSEKILGRLAQGEVTFCQDPRLADVLIINTCGFVKDAKEESIDTILRMARFKEENGLEKLIVTGCLAERYEKDLLKEIPEIDHVVGLENFDRIAELSGITGEGNRANGSCSGGDSSRIRLTPRHYAYLKISEGCSNSCSYCAIPAIRGPFGSRPADEILREAEELAAGGAKELNLIAQDSTLYGIDLYGRQRLHELLEMLSEIDSIKWIRLLYAHP